MLFLIFQKLFIVLFIYIIFITYIGYILYKCIIFLYTMCLTVLFDVSIIQNIFIFYTYL